MHVFLSGGKKQINFYVNEHSPLKEFLSDKMWLSKPVYLADIFSRLNDFNSLLQGIASIYFQCATKLMVSKEVVKKKYENELRNQSPSIARNGARLCFN